MRALYLKFRALSLAQSKKKKLIKSNSEDEDAPSALTRRISSLNLSRQPSTSSVHSSHSYSHPRRPGPLRVHPLSRSYSSGSFPNDNNADPNHDAHEHEHDDDADGLDEFGRLYSGGGGGGGGRHRSEWSSSSLPNFKQRQSMKTRVSTSASTSPKTPSFSYSSIPPTSWQKRGQAAAASGGGGGRTSTSSAGSGFSLELSIPEHADGEGEEGQQGVVLGEGPEELTTIATRTPRSIIRPPSRGRGRRNTNPKSDDTLSTASTLSIPFPLTPHDDHDPSSSDFAGAALTSSTTVGRSSKVDKDKSLPPLPPSLKRATITSSNLRARTISSSGGASLPNSTTTTIPAPAPAPTPRPLKLSQSNLAQQPSKQVQIQIPTPAPSRQGDRPAVPVPTPTISSSSSSSSTTALFGTTAARRPRLAQLQLPSPILLNSRTATMSSPITPSSLSSPPSASALAPGTPPGTPGGPLKPKSRTGTGMVYRNSTASRMRAPTLMRTSTPGVPIAL